MKIIAKFRLTRKTESHWSIHQPPSRSFVFDAAYDDTLPEDRRFARATPSGHFEMTVDNPPVVEFLEQNLGKSFYFHIEVAETE